MSVHYEIRQRMKTPRRTWLEPVAANIQWEVSAHIGYDQMSTENPDEYFELVRVEVIKASGEKTE